MKAIDQARTGAGTRSDSLLALLRIARELRDTLLQSFHGLLLRRQTACELLPGRPAEARQSLQRAVAQAPQAITDRRE